jgi:hypothetical protein
MFKKVLVATAALALLGAPANALTNEIVSGCLREASTVSATTVSKSSSEATGSLSYKDTVRTADGLGVKEVVGTESYKNNTASDTTAYTHATSNFSGSLARVTVRY